MNIKKILYKLNNIEITKYDILIFIIIGEQIQMLNEIFYILYFYFGKRIKKAKKAFLP